MTAFQKLLAYLRDNPLVVWMAVAVLIAFVMLVLAVVSSW